jgi:hypothetical protein
MPPSCFRPHRRAAAFLGTPGPAAGALSRRKRRQRNCSPAPENFFANGFHRKATPFMGRTIFGQVFVREGMTEISKMKSPPYRGSSAPQQPFGRTNGAGGLPLFIAPPLAGSLLARLRCAGPCQSRCRGTLPPSRCRYPSQAAFAPSARSRRRSSVGRASRLERRRA